MPNHVTNELIFRDVCALTRNEILAKTCGAEGKVDFDILVPLPVNIWWGNVGERHEKAFGQTALDWCTANWGTKWNAYRCVPAVQAEDTLTLQFDTAWSPPYPWLAAIFNSLKVSFEHNWMSEYDNIARHGVFNATPENDFAEQWTETLADEALQRRIHVLRWGVEAFEDEDA